MRQFLRRVAASIRRRRIERAERQFETKFGTETSGYWYLDEHGLPSEDRVWYDPSNWKATQRAFARLQPTSSDVCIDIGSGKGRGLLIAGGFPFGRIIGVELSSEMTDVARAAITKNLPRLTCTQFEFVTADVLEYDIPADVNVVYMYCPFVGEVFEQFIDGLLSFVDRNPRRVRVVYNYPLHHDLLMQTGRFRTLDVVSALWPAKSLALPEVIVTYEVSRRDEPATSLAPLSGDAARWQGPYDPGFVVERGPDAILFRSPGWNAPRDAGEADG